MLDKKWYLIAVSGISSFFAKLVGLIPGYLMNLLMVLMLVDVVTGVILAIYQHRLNSSVMGSGLLRKAVTLLIVFTLAVVDDAIFPTSTLTTAVIIFFMLSETLSILEKAAKMKVPLPVGVVKRLEKLREDYTTSDEPQEQVGNGNRRN